jgi:hypothetical protein
LYFWPNLKSIFTYQNGLESKKLFSEIVWNTILHPNTSEAKFQVQNFIFTRISSCPTVGYAQEMADLQLHLDNVYQSGLLREGSEESSLASMRSFRQDWPTFSKISTNYLIYDLEISFVDQLWPSNKLWYKSGLFFLRQASLFLYSRLVAYWEDVSIRISADLHHAWWRWGEGLKLIRRGWEQKKR